MDKETEKENYTIKINYFLKVNIKMEKDGQEKNMMIEMVN